MKTRGIWPNGEMKRHGVIDEARPGAVLESEERICIEVICISSARPALLGII